MVPSMASAALAMAPGLPGGGPARTLAVAALAAVVALAADVLPYGQRRVR